jgi:hypothetical protein
MNEICQKCDTRCQLELCEGKTGDFKYCFRKIGSTFDLKETITPFNTLHELYEKCKWLDWVIPESLLLDNKQYGGDNMVLLLGQYGAQKSDNKLPLGFVTVLTTKGMKPIKYEEENENISR